MKEGCLNAVYKDVSFEFVSMYETIEKLLSNEEYRTTLSDFDTSSSKKQDYFDTHMMFKNKNHLRILLYYDDLEMCNGLGDVAGVYKGGMFYFTLLNVTRKHYSNLRNIFLVAVCHSEDLKKFGYNAVLELIMRDVKKLENKGILIQDKVFRASIAQCVGDNLGIHQIFGLQQK